MIREYAKIPQRGAKNAEGGSPISSILGVATGGDKLGCWFLNQIGGGEDR